LCRNSSPSVVLLHAILNGPSKVQKDLGYPDRWPVLKLTMINRHVFIILVVLSKPKESVVYSLGLNRKVITQPVRVSYRLPHPNDVHNIRQTRRGKRKNIKKFCGILREEDDVAFQAEMRCGVPVLKADDATREMGSSY
jgi:hypothetical protein